MNAERLSDGADVICFARPAKRSANIVLRGGAEGSGGLNALELEGARNCIDVFVSGPSSWATGGTSIIVAIWRKLYGIETLVQAIDLSTVPNTSLIVQGGTVSGFVVGLRGLPADAFIVRVNGGTAGTAGRVAAIAWGEEAALAGAFAPAGASLSNVTTPPGIAVVEQAAPTAEDNVNGVIGVAFKPLAVGGAYATTRTTAFNTIALAIKNGQGTVFSAIARNRNVAVRFFQVFNKVGAPVLNDVPALVVAVAPANGIPLGPDAFSPTGMFNGVGISIGYSTTEQTYTAATAADHDVTMFFA